MLKIGQSRGKIANCPPPNAQQRLAPLAYNIAKVQNSCIAFSLKVFWYGSMEWNVKENCQYGIEYGMKDF